jgi:hypothetical protein
VYSFRPGGVYRMRPRVQGMRRTLGIRWSVQIPHIGWGATGAPLGGMCAEGVRMGFSPLGAIGVTLSRFRGISRQYLGTPSEGEDSLRAGHWHGECFTTWCPGGVPPGSSSTRARDAGAEHPKTPPAGGRADALRAWRSLATRVPAGAVRRVAGFPCSGARDE